MRVAALYDIHGNLPALQAVLAEIDAIGFDRIVVGGDVALGPLPRETLDLLMARGDRVSFIRGNCDREMIEALQRAPDPSSPWAARTSWAAARLTVAQRRLLAGLPLTLTLQVGGVGSVLFCHASPRSDDEIITLVSPEGRVAPMLAGVGADLVVGGHTHSQYDRIIGGQRMINAGSVGIPYESRRGAFWAALGPDVSMQRTDYDLERAVNAIRATEFPESEEFTKKYLLAPQSAAEAGAFFEKIAEEKERVRATG